MTALPDIPRLYTALAECLAVLLVTPALAPRFSRAVTGGITLLWAVVLSAFLGLTGNVPGRFWIPCMAAAIGLSYLYLWGVWSITLLEAGYHCARAFILAELAASVEWQGRRAPRPPPRQRSLNDHQIRCGLVLAVPHPADDRRRLNGGNDRRNLRRRPFHILRQGNWKSRARYDQVSARLDRRFNVLRIVFRRHHDIKAHDTALRDRARLL